GKHQRFRFSRTLEARDGFQEFQEGFMRFLKIGTVGAEPVAEVNDVDSAALIFLRDLRVSVVSVFHTKYG
ncbi:MAG: hypothetical protein ABIK68_16155, partial [bacterium]